MALKGVPPNGELWKIGNKWWVVYTVPDSNPPVPLAWKVEKSEDVTALVGPGGSASPARTFANMGEATAVGLLDMGTRAELAEFTDDPFETFAADYEEQAQALPMLQDPEVASLFAGALLEGRQPTPEELTQTSWWQTRSEAEREWATLALQDPKTARQRKADRQRAVRRMLREAGVSDAPASVIDLVTNKWATGQWTDSMVTNQILALSDPYAGIELSGELVRAGRGFDPTSGDAGAVAGGEQSVRKRIEDIFANRGLDPNTHLDGTVEEGRLERLVQEVMSGSTSLDKIRQTADRSAGTHPLTGRDITRAGEDDVRALATRWLGPRAGNWDDAQVRDWAGRMRNDPDAEQSLVGMLKRQRRTLLPRYTDENLTYEDIISPVRNIAVGVWKEPIQDESMLVDLANMDDYSAMEERLYREGLRKGVTAVRQKFEQDVLSATGGSVRQSVL